MTPLVLVVAAAAGLGAVLRYATDRAVQRIAGGSAHPSATLPWATLLVNAVGSLLLGVLTGLLLAGSLDPAAAAVLGAGFCGGLTTFSTWTYQTLRLVEEGALRAAVVNVAGSLFVGLALAAAGLALGSALA